MERVERARADDVHLALRVPLEAGADHHGLERVGQRPSVVLGHVLGTQEPTRRAGVLPHLELVELERQLAPRARADLDVGEDVRLGTSEKGCSTVPLAGTVTSTRLPTNPGASPTIVTRPVGSPSNRYWPTESAAAARSSWGIRMEAPRIGAPAESTIFPVRTAEPWAETAAGTATPRNMERRRDATTRRSGETIMVLPRRWMRSLESCPGANNVAPDETPDRAERFGRHLA